MHHRSGRTDFASKDVPQLPRTLDFSRSAVLVAEAADGDDEAWRDLVEQYMALVWGVLRRLGLSADDAADAAQTTWLRLLENVGRLHDPARVGLWLATTARREGLRILARPREVPLPVDADDDVLDLRDDERPDVADGVLAEERALQVRQAVAQLPEKWRSLVELLCQDPPVSYGDISVQLGLPVGSIGPTRGRCVRRLQALLVDV